MVRTKQTLKRPVEDRPIAAIGSDLHFGEVRPPQCLQIHQGPTPITGPCQTEVEAPDRRQAAKETNGWEASSHEHTINWRN